VTAYPSCPGKEVSEVTDVGLSISHYRHTDQQIMTCHCSECHQLT